MALTKQTLDIAFTAGINSKVAEKLLQSPSLLEVSNIEQTLTGEFSKRNGTTLLDQTTVTGLTNIEMLARNRNQLLALDKDNLWSYNEASDNTTDNALDWRLKGGRANSEDAKQCILCRVKENTIISDPQPSRINVLTAYANGYLIIGSLLDDYDVSGTSYKYFGYSIIDINTGQTVYRQANTTNMYQPGSTNLYFKVVTFGNYVGFVYATDATEGHNHLYCICINTLTLAETIVDLGNCNTTLPYFAVCDYSSTNACIVFHSATTASCTLSFFNETGLTGTPQTISTCTQVMALYKIPVSNKLFIVEKSTSNLNWYYRAADLTATSNNTVSITYGNMKACTVIADSITAPTQLYILFENHTSSTDKNPDKSYVTMKRWNITTAAWGIDHTIHGVGLGTEAFSYNDYPYVGLIHQSDTDEDVSQNTFFFTFLAYYSDSVDDSYFPVISRNLIGQAGEHNMLDYNMGTVVSPSTGRYITAKVKDGETVGGETTTNISKNVALIDLEFTKHGNWAELGGETFICGGVLLSYDGHYITESGFNLYPQTVSGTISSTGGHMSNGTYSFVVVYEWADNNGKIHRSAPSDPISFNLTYGTTTQKVTLTVPYLRLTQKPNVRVQIYRTQDTGSVYYYCGGVLNSVNSNSTTFDVTISDATLRNNITLYTTGQVLDHIAPPSLKSICVYKNRIFGITDNYIYYSKEAVEGQGVAFSDALRIVVDPAGGELRGLTVQGDTLVIAQSNQIMAISGDPANDLGQESTLSSPTLITSDFGLKENNPMISWGEGTIIPTDKGIWMLDKGFSPSYIGAPVETYNSYDIKETTVLQDKNQVRFLLTGTTTQLVYDFYHSTWQTFTLINDDGQAAVIWDKKYCWGDSTGKVYKENTTWDDNSTDVIMSLTTPWINFQALAGFARVYSIDLLGTFRSSHTLNVKLYYQDGTTTETFTEAITSAPSTEYLYRIVPAVQKCRCIKIQIYDSNVAGTEQSFSINGIRINYATKSKYPYPDGKVI